jgi:hypothetical protein
MMVSHRHDNIAALLGVPAPKFKKLNKDLAAKMKHTMGLYMKSLKKMLTPGGTVDDASVTPALAQPKLEMDSARFPKIPSTMSFNSMNKLLLENVFRMYIS